MANYADGYVLSRYMGETLSELSHLSLPVSAREIQTGLNLNLRG